jgi:hypothetical protein
MVVITPKVPKAEDIVERLKRIMVGRPPEEQAMINACIEEKKCREAMEKILPILEKERRKYLEAKAIFEKEKREYERALEAMKKAEREFKECKEACEARVERIIAERKLEETVE